MTAHHRHGGAIGFDKIIRTLAGDRKIQPKHMVRDHANFKLLFDTSHAYMGAVVGARQTGECERLPGGAAEYGRRLGAMVGHLHLIDSNGKLHNNETSTHEAFGEGQIDFGEVLTAMKPVISRLPWWCVDFCFNPRTPTTAKEAVPTVRRLMREAMP